MSTIIRFNDEKETENYIIFCIKSGFKFKAIGRTTLSVTF